MVSLAAIETDSKLLRVFEVPEPPRDIVRGLKGMVEGLGRERRLAVEDVAHAERHMSVSEPVSMFCNVDPDRCAAILL